ncbi:MAG: diguanylate cyclase [Halomonas sp.]|nr:EAL domain-containing protein [Halomonas sp.]MBF56255.1 diguanylate cyclase [Halomonas sp.]|tara:strand:- start:2937 stop:5141 length:2205 start_codon:yes stop_codon:yes gene_type:complete
MGDNNHEPLVFSEDIAELASPMPAPWKILIVDDDPDVHAATKLALKGSLIEERTLSFVDAYSAAEGLSLLEQDADFAVALIDVVMESDDSGLNLVQNIRDKLNNHSIRLILRTGQPGYAPESDTIRLYDINDYKTKAELTRIRLFTSVTIAIRSYSQIKQLEAKRDGLKQILAATSELTRLTNGQNFSSVVIKQLCVLLKTERECLVCAASHGHNEPPFIVAATGHFSSWLNMPLASLPNERIRTHLTQALNERQHLFHDGVCVYFPGKDNQALAAFVDMPRAISSSEQRLLAVLCGNIAVAYENFQLYRSIEQLAYQDPLVCLPNRNGFVAEIERQMRLNATTPQAVVLVDLDNFTYINSVLDDAYGDDILRAVAQRLCSQLSKSLCIARVSGDVFGILGDASDLTPESIETVFAEPFRLHQNEPLRLSATSGLIILDKTSRHAMEILKNAGVALKQAKHFHRGKTVLFATELADAARDRMQLLSRLRVAFSSERLTLHFQPFIRLHDGAAMGAECLLRWQTAEGQHIPPDHFIPLAEQSGMIVALGDWVIRTALRWRAGLIGRVDDTFRVAINVSLVQLIEDNFVANILHYIHTQGLQGYHVEIELTESMAAHDINSVIQKLKQMREHGISIAIDDFGTGYSSLSILSSLPIDRLKIDRSFVSGDAANQPHFGIAHTVIELATNLQMHTIAEGIETESQRDTLRQNGCLEGQGYLFSRPLDEAQFNQWLAQQ